MNGKVIHVMMMRAFCTRHEMNIRKNSRKRVDDFTPL